MRSPHAVLPLLLALAAAPLTATSAQPDQADVDVLGALADLTAETAPREVQPLAEGEAGGPTGGDSTAAVGGGASELAGPPRPSGLEWDDPATREAYLAAVREYYAYRVDGLRHRRSLFWWQLASSKVIFAVVVLLVLAGVYFSGVQFHAALKPRPVMPSPPGGAEAAAAAPAFTGGLGGEIEAGAGRFKLSSPVLGVIILSLSFFFFYLYIVHVHPIHEIL